MIQFIGHRNQIEFFVRFRAVEAGNVYNMILKYITLSTNETCAFRFICFFGSLLITGALNRQR